MAHVLTRNERQRDGAVADLGIALGDGGERLPQGPVDGSLTRHQPTAHGGEELLGSEHRAAGDVGVDNSGTFIDQEHARAETIEDIGENRALGLPAIDQLADPNGAANVRGDQLHALDHHLIDEAARFMAGDDEGREVRGRPFEHDTGRVDPALRL